MWMCFQNLKWKYFLSHKSVPKLKTSTIDRSEGQRLSFLFIKETAVIIRNKTPQITLHKVLYSYLVF